jgi:hypothetical protein
VRPVERVFVSVCTALVASCGGATREAPPPPAAPELPPLPELDLLVPDGATLVVVAEPAKLLASTAVRALTDRVLAPALLDGFARRTGIEPHEVERVVGAEHGDGVVWIARGPWSARDVVRAAERRMTGVEASADTPFFRRAGYLGTERWDVTALGDDVVLATRDAPGPTAAILHRAAHGAWAEGAAAALDAEDVASLRRDHAGAPGVLYVPVPLDLPPGFGTSTLLARERALAATVVPEDPDGLRFEVALVGEFPEGVSVNFRNLVESVASSDLGMALGIAEALETLRIVAEPGSVRLSLLIPARSLAMGLRVLFLADLEELLGEGK